MAKESQKDKVVKWLKSGKSLTPLEALQNGMGMRLGAIIHTLRHEEEMDIVNLNKSGKDRFAEYKLKQKVEKQEQSTLDLGNTSRFKYPD
jgi:hypothetical protein|tara:strand:+ start:720 stop:989 length:270 start_codon:yes stop_codon:yes gene_type:complete